MDSLYHGPGGDESKDSKPAALLSGGLTGPDVQVSEPIASSGAPAAAAEALLAQDEGKKEGGQVKAQQQKPALKKPDKLAPCPRCDSLDTKFCYYNNYNVNQPRHFCKNCQRYWTAGGTLRNVPVGAGRRKNKHGSLHARHASMPDPVARPDSVGMAQPRPFLARGQSAPELRPPLHATSASSTIVSSIPISQERHSSDAVTQTSTICVEHEKRPYIPAEPQMSISCDHGGSRSLHTEHGGGNSDPDLACEAEKDDGAEACTSSAPGSPSQQDTSPTAHEVQSMVKGPATTLQPVCAGVIRPVGILDGSGLWTAAPTPFGLYNGSWPYGYNVGWSGPPPGAPGPPLCPPGGALVTCQPGVGGLTAWPAPPNGLFCWGSTIIPGMPPGLAGPSWMAPGWGGGWSMPWGGADAAAAAAAAASASVPMQATAGAMSTGSGTAFPSKLPIRPVLSKHPRDRLELERVESSLWVPKMVRLDDPGNVSRSSVWTAVGTAEKNPESSVTSGSNFKAFLPVVGDDKASVTSGDEKQAGVAP